MLLRAFTINELLKITSTYQTRPKTKPKSKQGDGGNMANTFKVLAKDRILQCLILANVLCLFIYAQMDSTLIQYLTREQAPNLLTLISTMLLTNALVIICSQFVLLKIMTPHSLTTRISVGLMMLMLSQIWFAFNPMDFFVGWVGAVVVLSLGEAILFPSMSVHIDRIAPQALRGAYFGATSLYSLGFALAPIGGGYILEHWGGRWLFLSCAILTIALIVMYQWIARMSRPSSVTQTCQPTEQKTALI